jgi:hypothetical protein
MSISGGNEFASSDAHGGCFQAIREYFQQRSCRMCSKPYTAEGIELLRTEPGVLVVRVACAACGHPLGIALVGTRTGDGTAPLSHAGRGTAIRAKRRAYPASWTQKDVSRLSSQPPISYDDILNVHEFLNHHGDDWSRYLPATSTRERAGTG